MKKFVIMALLFATALYAKRIDVDEIIDKGQTIWSENLADIALTPAFEADSIDFLEASGVDTGYFSIGFPYQKYGDAQTLDSLMVCWCAETNDTIRKAYLIEITACSTVVEADSFTTPVGGPDSTCTTLFTNYVVPYNKAFRLKLIAKQAAELRFYHITYFLDN